MRGVVGPFSAYRRGTTSTTTATAAPRAAERRQSSPRFAKKNASPKGRGPIGCVLRPVSAAAAATVVCLRMVAAAATDKSVVDDETPEGFSVGATEKTTFATATPASAFVTDLFPPPELNHTALALLLHQFQRQQECGNVLVAAAAAAATGLVSGGGGGTAELAASPAHGSSVDDNKRCDERALHRALMGYGFLVVFCLALIGNCLNLFICNSDQIRFYIAIRMLCTKLLMNTLTMTFLVPQAFRIINLWEPGSASDVLYWKFWPYQAYFINVFGFCAMWLTVLMTAECYLYIFFPGQSKALCTKKNLSRSYVLMGGTGLLLALIYPLNRTVTLRWHCDNLLITISASQSDMMTIFERVHTVANLLLAIIVPLTLLVFMTASIVWRLIIRPSEFRCATGAPNPPSVAAANGGNATIAWNGGTTAAAAAGSASFTSNTSSTFNHFGCVTAQHFSSEKRGVTRITLITTLLQLITETPSVPVLISATLFGPNIVQSMCVWQTVSHFLGLCNASLSFFVYITFSNRFRNSILRRAEALLHKCCPRNCSEKQQFVVTSSGCCRLRNSNSFKRLDIGGGGSAPFNSHADLFRALLRPSKSDTPLSPHRTHSGRSAYHYQQQQQQRQQLQQRQRQSLSQQQEEQSQQQQQRRRFSQHVPLRSVSSIATTIALNNNNETATVANIAAVEQAGATLCIYGVPVDSQERRSTSSACGYTTVPADSGGVDCGNDGFFASATDRLLLRCGGGARTSVTTMETSVTPLSNDDTSGRRSSAESVGVLLPKRWTVGSGTFASVTLSVSSSRSSIAQFDSFL